MIGTLSKSKGNYTTSSVLYSIRDKRIMSKSHYKSGSLFKLAEGELNQIFFKTLRESHVDAAIVLDLSYKIAPEWESVKKGIINFTDVLSDNWSVDTSINILPFSDRYSIPNKILHLNSNPELENKLKTIAPQGELSATNFKDVLDYSIKRMPWRRNSEKILILITNSDTGKSSFFEKFIDKCLISP